MGTINAMTTPPGWCQDPENLNGQRWWDGQQWGAQAGPPPPPPTFASPGAAPYSQPPQTGYGQGSYGGAAKPANYLVWSILVTLMCFFPFGVVSIINAAKVDSLWHQGRHEESANASAKAKKWAIVSAVSVAVLLIVYIVIAMIVIGVDNLD